ncbi:hypothetical protein F511_06252 [Dorcoceras hygrometricum]|uniref:Myb/SANT-like domain-containing protein n=1 Tax=Dorcoceras hygrometricum TaxID=472368 RepID=A0A2Z7B4C6_9LAMI|nr:hypothetical protein F511_06252 [Dorcoceras hygrometricum]
MESGETCGSVIGRTNKVDKTRRTWTAREEEVLITALKDVITKGWKRENGFKAGKNDVGWNETDKTVEATDETCDALIKTDSTFRTMRHKQWTHFPDWCEIFGNDRATGEHSQSFQNALKDVLNLKDDVPNEAKFGDAFAGNTSHGDDDSISETNTPSSKPKVATTSKKRKRNQVNEVDNQAISARLLMVATMASSTSLTCFRFLFFDVVATFGLDDGVFVSEIESSSPCDVLPANASPNFASFVLASCTIVSEDLAPVREMRPLLVSHGSKGRVRLRSQHYIMNCNVNANCEIEVILTLISASHVSSVASTVLSVSFHPTSFLPSNVLFLRFPYRSRSSIPNTCNATLLKIHQILIVKPSAVDETCGHENWKWFKTYFGMESGETCGSVIGRTNKVDKTRRTWTAREEEVLITALKDVITKGWKNENGFKAGYVTLSESAMHAAIPCCTLRGNPHINSKVHVWKKTYSTLIMLLGKSGVGWNETDKTVEATDETCDALIKTDSTFRTMRHKQWTHFPDWCEIFGNDRATGEHSQSFQNALKDVLNLKDDVPNEAKFGDAFAGNTSHGDDDSISETNTPSSKPKVATTSKKRKRNQVNEVDNQAISARLLMVATMASSTSLTCFRFLFFDVVATFGLDDGVFVSEIESSSPCDVLPANASPNFASFGTSSLRFNTSFKAF